MNNNSDFKILVVKKDGMLFCRVVYQNPYFPKAAWETQGLTRHVESVTMPEVRLNESELWNGDGDMLFMRGYNKTKDHTTMRVFPHDRARALKFFEDINKRYINTCLVNQE
jgi:hypothetical protein